MSNKRWGLTLLELLVVVALVAILSSIAIMNMHEASTRSKVARAKNDLRANATGLETYLVDYSQYPLPNPGSLLLPDVLTSPVGYVTASGIYEIFLNPRIPFKWSQRYRYAPSYYYTDNFKHVGRWHLGSNAPDGEMGPVVPSLLIGINYDPTNGTVSEGDVNRTQMSSEPVIL